MAVQDEEVLDQSRKKPRRTHVVEEFRFLNAIDKKSAVKLEDLGLDLDFYEEKIDELIALEILIPTTKTKYYLDNEAYGSVKEQNDKKFFLTLVSIIIPGILFILLGIALIIIGSSSI
ncbi:MAG: hypothetical protein ACTSO7_02910 [Candidatus Heimdallarchaeota archaeon]